ncbi:SH3 domain-containing protein [Clostridium senegalense]|uniref:SH3 domain-containing protein n=1 Tax=Clostridium senegalense TaxID=1465809 RepID=UPI000289E508|nr:SH3 domain-containing protein [Clostridium senegalense]
MGIDIYLKKDNDTFHFPVNPLEKICIQSEKKYLTVEILDFGEVDIPDKGKKITELSFDTFFPEKYDESFCRYIDIPTPDEAIELLQKWKNSIASSRLIITDLNFNELVNINSLTVEDRAGEIGDKYISISFRTHRDIKIETLNTQSSSSSSLKNNRSTQSGKFNRNDIVRVTADVLNVRNGPGTNNGIIGSVSNGTKLKVWRAQGNWLDVFYGNHGGWICSDYVTK